MKILLIIISFLPSFIIAQNLIDKQIDSLKFVTEMPYICEGDFDPNKYGCGNKLFWNVVSQKENAITALIERLNDTTKTKAGAILFGYNYTIADIGYVALEEIIHNIPTFELLGIDFDKNGCGYCSYWQHLNESFENRNKFKKSVSNWYDANKNNLIWIKKNTFSSCDCSGEHPNNGHFEIKLSSNIQTVIKK